MEMLLEEWRVAKSITEAGIIPEMSLGPVMS